LIATAWLSQSRYFAATHAEIILWFGHLDCALSVKTYGMGSREMMIAITEIMPGQYVTHVLETSRVVRNVDQKFSLDLRM
tara:strand:+ start:1278 stop:1517 length:240 start_codon:yes stop_codon:yes gene_type:complete